MEAAKRADEITGRLGPVFRSRREALGLSMNELSTRAGLTVSFIGYLETGQRRPSVDSLCRLAFAFNCEPSELLRSVEGETIP